MPKSNMVVKTAEIIFRGLSHKEWRSTARVYSGILRNNGNPNLLHASAKLLRDNGVPLIAIKARDNSKWKIASTEGEIAQYAESRAREMYSFLRSYARSIKHISPVQYNLAISQAIAIMASYMTAQSILDDCETQRSLTL